MKLNLHLQINLILFGVNFLFIKSNFPYIFIKHMLLLFTTINLQLVFSLLLIGNFQLHLFQLIKFQNGLNECNEKYNNYFLSNNNLNILIQYSLQTVIIYISYLIIVSHLYNQSFSCQTFLINECLLFY